MKKLKLFLGMLTYVNIAMSAMLTFTSSPSSIKNQQYQIAF